MTQRLRETLRDEIERGASGARTRMDRQTDTARQRVGVRTGAARSELGERLFDLGEEYFPAVAARRRRRVIATGFVAGLAVGFAVRSAIGR